jgi:hypothetical protein
MDKGLEFMLEGALNKDVEASSITCRLMADDGSSEEKYYLRHDEAKVRTLAPPSSSSSSSSSSSNQSSLPSCLLTTCLETTRIDFFAMEEKIYLTI